jgi:D-alanyl-D-alanine carboxypeptidase
VTVNTVRPGAIIAHLLLIAAVLAATLIATPPGLAAKANTKFAAISIDAGTGKVLYANAADARRHPASLTKIMTLYILFQEMQAGRVTRSATFTVSGRAAARPPSKLNLQPGQTITVESAIGALVTKSANDVATTIAENISGSEQAFARRMTATARRLGMTRTRFTNASGLPDPEQITTARDMATLGLAMLRHFPRRYAYFGLRSFQYGKRTFRNHNRLLGKYPGVDGIKTGYIRASGYNLATSARRGRKRVVAVVMGGRTPKERNDYMVELLNQAFGVAGKSVTRATCNHCARADQR